MLPVVAIVLLVIPLPRVRVAGAVLGAIFVVSAAVDRNYQSELIIAQNYCERIIREGISGTELHRRLSRPDAPVLLRMINSRMPIADHGSELISSVQLWDLGKRGNHKIAQWKYGPARDWSYEAVPLNHDDIPSAWR